MQDAKKEMSKKCDFCKENATFCLTRRGLFKRKVCFCKECLKKIANSYAEKEVPKGIESPFRPKVKIRREKL